MTIKGYSAFPKAPASLEPHHQNVCHIQDPRWRGPTPLQRCSRCILQPQPTGQYIVLMSWIFVFSFMNRRLMRLLHIFFFKKRNYIVNWITMTRKPGKHLWVTYGTTAVTMTNWFGIASARCGPVALWYSFGYAYCGRWFDLQWERSRYTLPMRPNKSETAAQLFYICAQVYARFSGHGSSICTMWLCSYEIFWKTEYSLRRCILLAHSLFAVVREFLFRQSRSIFNIRFDLTRKIC